MADQWYFARPYTEFGPFSAAQLQELAATGQIQPQDTVWKEGTEKRVSAAKVKELFSAPRVLPPPAGPNGHANGGVSPPPTLPRLAASQPPTLTGTAPAFPRPEEATATTSPILDPADDFELADGEPAAWTPPVANPPTEPTEAEQPAGARTAQQQEAKKLRVIGVKGGILASQDGDVVKYRKKCLRCGYVDNSMTTMRIRSGVTRLNFFCPKCKKNQQVEVQGVG
jgi:ribosomal protein S27AE